MKKFLKYRHEAILGVIGIFLLGIIISIAAWEFGFMAQKIGKAIGSGSGTGPETNFDLKGAKQLNLKGLAQ